MDAPHQPSTDNPFTNNTMYTCGSRSPPNSPQRPTPPPSTNNPPARKKAPAWVLKDNITLINLLIDHKAEAGEGGNFKKSAGVMVDRPSIRGLKTWEACRSRWIKLRKDYNLALQLKQNLSGFTFVDQEGVVVDDESVWSEFALKNHEAVWVGRVGFPCFELMSSLMLSAARGTHVYRVSTSAYGTGTQSGQGSDQGVQGGGMELDPVSGIASDWSQGQSSSSINNLSSFGLPPSAFGLPPSSLDPPPSAFNPPHSAVNPPPSVFDPLPSSFNHLPFL
ncbi:hypothetical protein K439DRAFT_1614187 [Ramaria rubella]|nr:hypothetical protein K439DRAFT_1614187 [Ramaria rubella]